VLTTDRRFAIRESESGVWLCEFAGAPKDSVPASGEDLEGCRKKLLAAKVAATRLPDLIGEILSTASGPLELSDLTTLAAHALGITDRTESVDDHSEFLLDPAVRFAHSAELKDRLTWLWNEVRQLPLLQRIALLLNLGAGNGSNGEATLCAIADLRIATFGALAAILEMTEAELANIWNRVPLPDNEIAARLQLDRQQVINLRASARQRLVRRMTVIDNMGSGANTRPESDTKGAS
jgi:hypothetical protein